MEETGKSNVDHDANHRLGREILEDSLEEEVKNCAIKGANNSEGQYQQHIFPFLSTNPHHTWDRVFVSIHMHAHPVTGPRALHQFPTCSLSLSRLCDLWCRPPRDFNLHRDKCNKRNNLEITAKEDTFTNPSPKVGCGCHHVICAGDEAGRGRGGERAGEGGLGKRKHPQLSPPHPLCWITVEGAKLAEG